MLAHFKSSLYGRFYQSALYALKIHNFLRKTDVYFKTHTDDKNYLGL